MRVEVITALENIMAIPLAILVLNLSVWIRKIGFKPKNEKYFDDIWNIGFHIFATMFGIILGIGFIISRT